MCFHLVVGQLLELASALNHSHLHFLRLEVSGQHLCAIYVSATLSSCTTRGCGAYRLQALNGELDSRSRVALGFLALLELLLQEVAGLLLLHTGRGGLVAIEQTSGVHFVHLRTRLVVDAVRTRNRCENDTRSSCCHP